MIDERYTIVQEERFIEATRDSGYKSTASAISEIADNAFQADANEFIVHFRSNQPEYSGRGKPPSPVIEEVIYVHDGTGMTPDILRLALRFGGTSRFNDRSGMGRFGMGLPNSSVSQCRRLEVYTWKDPSKVYFCYLDIDEIRDGKMLVVPEPVQMNMPDKYDAYAIFKSGTMVVWKDCDRLDYAGREDTLTRELPKTLGQTYRYYLASGKKLHVNGRDVKPFDPLFVMPEAKLRDELASEHGAPIKKEIRIPGGDGRTSTVTIRFSLLPESWQAYVGKSTPRARELGVDRATGFSIVRAGREVDFGYFRLRSPHWTNRWWSCEIAFEPELDELFGMTHTKQQITLSERIRSAIEKDLSANIGTLHDIIVARGKQRHASDSKKAESIAKDREKFMRASPSIRGKDPDTAERELREYVEARATEGDEVDLDDIRDRPFLLDFENLPGAPFYRVRTFGKTTVVTLNREHSFFEVLYQPLCDMAPASKTALELLLFALAKAETLAEDKDEGRVWYRSQRHEWSRILSVYLEGVESLEELVD